MREDREIVFFPPCLSMLTTTTTTTLMQDELSSALSFFFPYLFLHQSPDLDVLEAGRVCDQRRRRGLARSWVFFLLCK